MRAVRRDNCDLKDITFIFHTVLFMAKCSDIDEEDVLCA